MVIIYLRNKLSGLLYTNIVRRICFRINAEKVHVFFVKAGSYIGSSYLAKKMLSFIFNYNNKILEQEIYGIKFTNPVGLSAGFDKNAELLDVIRYIGFGFAEVGSITAKPCSGNSGERLKRLPNLRSIWVNLGLNNYGAVKISNYLKKIKYSIPFGINIAKTNCRETADAKIGIEDYLFSLNELKDSGDYYTINISCPNAYGGQDFSDPVLFRSLFKKISLLNIKKPIFVKLSPDLPRKTIDKLIKISYKYNVSGFICSNLTKAHKFKLGGLSGKYLEPKADALISYIYKKTKNDFIIIGVGGIFSAEDAYKKIKMGASLIQLITGMIYKGPNLISEINYGLVKLLKKDGYFNIKEAIGAIHNEK